MPITLVTGLPGHGKTLYTLARWKPEAEKAGRPVFHNNIPGLAIPGWQAWEIKEWEKLPPNSLFIVDEAQFAFPVTGRGQTPDWVQKLATHRHLGLDFIVITQNPMLLDSFVRRLVDRHFHIVRKFGTKFATVYEFVNGVKDDVAKNRGDGIRHEFKYPKNVFEWYKSAEVHTVKSRIPARVYMLIVLPILFFALVWLGYQRMKPEAMQERMGGDSQEKAEARKMTPRTSGETAGMPPNANASGKMTPGEYVQAYTPRIAGLPHTAPIYDGVTQPKEAPYPAACISAAKRCQCYSQQGTRLDMEDRLCRELADGGFFVAWNQQGERVQQAAKSETPARAQPEGYASFNQAAPTFKAEPVDPNAGSLPRRVRPVVQ